MAILKNIFGKKKEQVDTDSELKAAVLKKATEHMNAGNDTADSSGEKVHKNMPAYEGNAQVKKQNIRSVLLEIVERGEAGVLATSISDTVGMSKLDASNALSFLTKNNYVEAVNSPIGVKFYLTDAGKKYCISKEFNS